MKISLRSFRPRPAEWIVIAFALICLSRMAWNGRFLLQWQTSIPRADFVGALLLAITYKLFLEWRGTPWPAGSDEQRKVHNSYFWMAFLPGITATIVRIQFERRVWHDVVSEGGGAFASIIHAIRTVVMYFMIFGIPPFMLWLTTGLRIKRGGALGFGPMARDLGPAALSALREFLPPFALLSCYGLLQMIVNHPISIDRDPYMARFDTWLFAGYSPVHLLERIVSPPLSEWMTFCYCFYVVEFPIIFGVLWAKKDARAFREAAFAMTLTMAAGYTLYFLVPVIGPLYVETFTVDLGDYIFAPIRHQMMDVTRVMRDCFPSLHTGGSMVVLWASYKHARRLFWAWLPMLASIPIACMYLRYHWFADVLAGATIAFIATRLAPWAATVIERMDGEGDGSQAALAPQEKNQVAEAALGG